MARCLTSACTERRAVDIMLVGTKLVPVQQQATLIANELHITADHFTDWWWTHAA